jgi:hypothetical protein
VRIQKLRTRASVWRCGYKNYVIGHLPGSEDTKTKYSVIYLKARIQKLRTRSSTVPEEQGSDSELSRGFIKRNIVAEAGYSRSSTVREQEHDGSFPWWRYHDQGFSRAGLYLLLIKEQD